jgi:hypothetical protein
MFSSTQTHPPTRAFTNLTHHTILPTQCRHLSHITTIPFHHLFHSIITHHSTPSTATNNMGCNSSPKYSQSTPLHHSVTNGLTVHTVATDTTPLCPSLEHAYNPPQHPVLVVRKPPTAGHTFSSCKHHASRQLCRSHTSVEYQPVYQECD